MNFKRIEEQIEMTRAIYGSSFIKHRLEFPFYEIADTMQALLDVANAAAEFVRTEQGADFDFITQDSAYCAMEDALAKLKEDK